jgi:tetratricopeptide (TPR) repeat protein
VGQILLISGEPGIGKSRMVRELVTQVEVAQDRALVGECYPDGGIPYAPFVQILQTAFRDSAMDDLNLADFVVADLFTLAPMLRLKYPDISPNPKLDIKSEQYRLFEHLTIFFTKLSEQSPLMLVVENIHWADGGTVSLLRHLARQVEGKKWLILATYRPAEPSHTIYFEELLLDLQRARSSTNMDLASLRRKESGELLNAIFAEEVAADFLDGIYRQTEGNPFYIEEVCKSLVVGSRVQFREGRWVLPRVDQLEIPTSVRAAILSRIKSLAPPTQEILQVAAIFGREFGFEYLAIASEKDEGSLIKALEEAERAQVISQLPGEGGKRFSFAHHLIPGAIREEMGVITRPSLHQRAAIALKALNLDDFEALAYHYAEAGDDKKARRYYVRAANRARQMIANQDAARFYSEALKLLPEGHTDRFDILAGRANVYNLLAMREGQRRDAEEMLSLAETTNDDLRRCDALIALADVYLPTEHGKARKPAEEAAKIAKKMGDLVREGHALRRVGDQAHRRYALASSRSALETAAARFRRTGLSAEAASCLSILSVVLGRLGENVVALSTAKEAVALSRVAGDRRLEATSMRRLAIMHLDQFRYEEALPFAEAALSLHQELGDRYEECNDLNTLGVVRAKRGDFDRAKTDFLRSLEIAEAIESLTAVLYAVNNLILFVYRYFGEYENGLTFLDSHLVKAQDVGNEFAIGTLKTHRASMLALLGQYDSALETIQDVLPVAERLMGLRARVGALSFAGLMYARLGDWLEAQRCLDEALQKGEKKGLPLDVAFPLISWAQTALFDGREQDLQEAIDRIEKAITLVASAGGSWVDVHGNALCTAAHLYLAISKGQDVPAHRALSRSSKVIRIAETSPEVAPPEKYNYVHSLALKANGKNEAAAEYLHQAHERVLLVADQCQDEDLKRSWLENVPENREILAAWETSTDNQ